MRKPLHETLTNRLRHLIVSDDAYSVDDKLPTEPVFARKLGVSRATLREALAQVENEGLIYRIHGLGTFVKSKKPFIPLKLSIPRSITHLLNSLGLIPGTKSMQVTQESVFPDDLERLAIKPGAKVYRIERIRTANGQPVAFTIDIVPAWVMKKLPEYRTNENFSLIEHLTDYSGLTFAETQATLIPLHNVQSVAEKLEIDPSAHIFFFEGVDHDTGGSPVLFSKEYFAPWIFRFTVVRTT